MSEIRMSLTEAAEALGIASNSVRSRWKAGKIRGERDNAGKIWVWIDTEKAANDKGSKEGVSKVSKPSIEAFEVGEINALRDHVKTLNEQLAIASAELSELRPKAVEAARLEAENKGLQAQLGIRAEQIDDLRQRLTERPEKAPQGFLARLFSR